MFAEADWVMKQETAKWCFSLADGFYTCRVQLKLLYSVHDLKICVTVLYTPLYYLKKMHKAKKDIFVTIRLLPCRVESKQW